MGRPRRTQRSRWFSADAATRTRRLHARLYREAARLKLRSVRRAARAKLDPAATVVAKAQVAAREDDRVATLLAHAAQMLERT